MIERIQQTLRDQLWPRRDREILRDHDELVSAKAPERIGGPHDAVEPRGNRAQEFIADTMTERVVNRLEVVEVDEQRRDRRLAATRAREHLLDAIQDQCAVGEPGQRIVCRQERELLIRAVAL